jgi:hypothetical protein
MSYTKIPNNDPAIIIHKNKISEFTNKIKQTEQDNKLYKTITDRSNERISLCLMLFLCVGSFYYIQIHINSLKYTKTTCNLIAFRKELNPETKNIMYNIVLDLDIENKKYENLIYSKNKEHSGTIEIENYLETTKSITCYKNDNNDIIFYDDNFSNLSFIGVARLLFIIIIIFNIFGIFTCYTIDTVQERKVKLMNEQRKYMELTENIC